MKNTPVECNNQVRLAFLMILLLSVMACSKRNERIGLGVFHFEPKEDASLKIYRNAQSDSQLFEVEARFSNSNARLYLRSNLNDSIRFNPVKYGQLRGFVSLRVLSSKGNRLKVVTNEQTHDTGWVEGTLEKLEDWESFLISLHHITSISGALHKSPNSDDLIDTRGNICLSVIDVQESWIKVEHNASRCDDRNVLPTGPAGFIRWKKEGKLLIHFRM